MPRTGAERSTQKMDLLEDWRRRKVLPYIRGRLLDIGCGFNNLVQAYSGPGVGIDVHSWPGIDVQIGDAARLPFAASSFDTVTIVAALNHIPNRAAALKEVHRVLRPEGHLVLTMIGPLTGVIAHVLFKQDEKERGGMRPGEEEGLRHGDLLGLLAASGFELQVVRPFQLGLNRVYVARKPAAPPKP